MLLCNKFYQAGFENQSDFSTFGFFCDLIKLRWWRKGCII